VVKKSLKVESQKRRETEAVNKKAAKVANQKVAKERKQAKLMQPRKEDMSQLADMVSLLSSSL